MRRNPDLELSRPLDVAGLPEGGKAIDFQADEAERQAIARRLGLAALNSLRVDGHVEPVKRGRIAVFEGTLQADVTQSCVVSLDPIQSRIDVPLRTELVNEAEAAERESSDLEEEEEGDWEVVEDGAVDLGELAVQLLALSLDPYPKRPDLQDAPPVEMGDGEAEDSRENEASETNPFAVLKKLKDKA
jgi:uncharacterized metal-binding protein YceD (DUF177 family)